MAEVTSSLGDAHILRNRHPGLVPVVCLMGDNSKAKLLTPATMQWQDYLGALRAQNPRASQTNARVLLAGMEPSKETRLHELDAQYCSLDGFLYVTLTLDHPKADAKVQETPLSSQGEPGKTSEQRQKSDRAATRQKSFNNVLKLLAAKHPRHVPVMCTADPDVKGLCGKLLVPDYITCADLGSVIRKHMSRPNEWTEADWEAAQIFVNQSDRLAVRVTIPNLSIGQLKNKCQDTLGVLRLVLRPPESKSPRLSDTPEEASTAAIVEETSSEGSETPRLNAAVKVEKDENNYSVAKVEQGQNEARGGQAIGVSVVDPYHVSDCDAQALDPFENIEDFLPRKCSSLLEDSRLSEECHISKRLLLVEDEIAATTQRADAAEKEIHDLLRKERNAVEMVEQLKGQATVVDLQNAELEELSTTFKNKCSERIAAAEMKVEDAERRAHAAEQRVLELEHSQTELQGLVSVLEESVYRSVEASNRSASESHIRFSQMEAKVSMLLQEVESERAHRQAVEQSAKAAEDAVVEHMLLTEELRLMSERCRVSELRLKEAVLEQESIAERLSVMEEKCCAAELRAQSSEGRAKVAEAEMSRMQDEARRQAEAALAEEIAITSSYVQISTPQAISTEDDDEDDGGFSLI